MNRTLLAVTLAAVVVAGCGRKAQTSATKSTNAPAAGANPLTAPVDYLGSIAKAKKAAEKVVDTASLNKAVQLFSASEGRYPKDLNELVTQKYLNSIPDAPYGMRIVYDATKGEVKVVAK